MFLRKGLPFAPTRFGLDRLCMPCGTGRLCAMEGHHRNKVIKKFKKHPNGKKIVMLGNPDDYD